MYTACVWLRESAQPYAARTAAGSAARNWRRFMSAPLSGVGALEIDVDVARSALRARALPQALGEQRDHDRDVVEADQHAARLPRQAAQHAHQKGERAQHCEEEHAADRAARVDQRLERDGD